MDRREKFRIRFYDGDTGFIRLEKKTKLHGLCNKQSAPLSAAEAESIANGDIDWMLHSPHELVRELNSKMRYQALAPKTVVDYTRRAFVYPPGNVRVTLDRDLRTALSFRQFFSYPHMPYPPCRSNSNCMEI